MRLHPFLCAIAGLSIFVLSAGTTCQSTGTTAKTTLTIMGDPGLLSSTTAKGTAEGDVTLSAALVAIDQVALKMEGENPNDNPDDGDIEFQGPYVVDLLDGAGAPLPDACILSEPVLSDVAQGTYPEVDVKISPDAALDMACPLAGETVYLAGTVTCSGQEIPFSFLSSLDEQLVIEGPNAFVVGDDPVEELIVLFQLDAWLADTDLCSASLGEDGTIRIDERNNSDLQSAIEQNITASIDAGEDRNGDHELEPDEDLENGEQGTTSDDTGSETGAQSDGDLDTGSGSEDGTADTGNDGDLGNDTGNDTGNDGDMGNDTGNDSDNDGDMGNDSSNDDHGDDGHDD